MERLKSWLKANLLQFLVKLKILILFGNILRSEICLKSPINIINLMAAERADVRRHILNVWQRRCAFLSLATPPNVDQSNASTQILSSLNVNI